VSRRGRLIAFEGGEACGKSTQAAILAADLDAVLTAEPGGTAVGARIRDLVLDPGSASVDPRAEALLMAADRAQHVAEVIRPALESGRDVVTDRFVGSSLAYQGYGRGLPLDEVRTLSTWATAGIDADLVLLLDVSLDLTRARLGEALDRMEREDHDFHRRVVAGFRELAAAEPGRWVVIDGTGTVSEVAARVAAAVRDRMTG
jgi:dTMP kinase